MGYSSWSADTYSARIDYRKATGTSAFLHDTDVRTGKTTNVLHEDMNPKGVIRESRDSDEHPESIPVAVLFDITGSMGSIPVTFQEKLGALMATLVSKGYVDHPQVLFGAVGDATTDRAPLQVGQFESGIEMDDDLGKVYIERGGGGQNTESYELAMYFMSRHTATDAWEKRRKRGYLFLLADEMPYPLVKRREVSSFIGDDLQVDIKTEDMVAELQEKWDVFVLVVMGGAAGRDSSIVDRWRDLFGQQAILLHDPSAVSETIALQIGLAEGRVFDVNDAAEDLITAGFDAKAVRSASTALANYTASTSVAKATASKLPAAELVEDDGRL